LAELSAVSTSKLGIFDMRRYPLKGGILLPKKGALIFDLARIIDL
jgi:hypothetical protein